ncbi:MAG: peptidoglycan DD-metalloendopeptidase family protein [Nitrospinae bacterium]|nr:peptidoglycan DD-metalloendopeptidase family protein [Nitrospinota bacterium]
MSILIRLYFGSLISAALLFSPVPALFAAHQDDTASKIEAEKNELAKLRKAMEEERQNISGLEDKEKSVLQKIQEVSRKLDLQKREVRVCERSIALNQMELSENEKKLRETEAIAENQKKILAKRVRFLYKEGDLSYLKAVFSSEGLSDLTRRITYMKLIAEADADMFRKILDNKEKLEKIKAHLIQVNNQLAVSQKEILGKKAKYEEEKEAKNRFLGEIQEKKSLYEKSLKELETASLALEELIRKLGEPAGEDALMEFAGLGFNLPWPVKGGIISSFGKAYNPEYRTSTFNNGIVIGSAFSEKVRAIAGGKVLFADWLKGYGRLLIIGHGKGYHSLYGYLDDFLVKAGAPVEKGQVIGEVGDTGSMRGPSLYLEIRKLGRPVDPSRLLSRQ